MNKRYEHVSSERNGTNGKKLYHEDYLQNRQIVLPEELFHFNTYMDSIWYPGYEFTHTGAPLCLCYMVKSGRLKIVNKRQNIVVRSGDCVVVREMSGGASKTLGNEPLCRTGIIFERNSFSSMLLSSLFPEPSTVVRLKDPKKFSDLLDALKKVILKDADDRDSVIHGLMFQMLYEAHRQRKQSDYPEELSRALNFINMGRTNKIVCDDIAAHCGISSRTLTRLFRDHFNCAPWQYIMKNRLEQAKNMLLFNKTSIKEIADLCGFYSAAHFTRMFKKQYEETPLKYRRNTQFH